MNIRMDDQVAIGIASAWETINNEDGMQELIGAFQQTEKFVTQGAKSLGVDLSGN